MTVSLKEVHDLEQLRDARCNILVVIGFAQDLVTIQDHGGNFPERVAQ